MPEKSEKSLELLDFPCRYEIKAMGKCGAAFEALVCEVVSRHLNGAGILDVATRQSARGRYLSVSCTIEAADRDQLDSIYLDLHSEADVLVTL
ncbi:MAG: DUF493 domain-containing protein [Pseudomonadota bacterium]|jgi:hypothetical protein|nr:DUF493 domain-containing protein [Pseudomonadota bacterium]MEE3288773.1 DUF493 domain-containing protein [Pseudomonadota bacterium]